MKPGVTDILALWGAVVSTLVAGWNIFRDVIQRDRLVVSASIMFTYPGKENIFNWSFRNKGAHELTVTHLAAMPYRLLHPRWLFGWLNGRRNGKQLLFPFEFMNGKLPLRVGPLNNAMAAYRLKPLGMIDFDELYATTADGREWFVKRRAIKDILANENFRAARLAYTEGRN